MTTPDPARLVQLLTDAGWRHVWRGEDFATFTWPGDHNRRLYVATDTANPRHGRLMAATLAELHIAADLGHRAQQVLDGLAAEVTE